MSTFTAVTSNITNVTKEALNGAIHPVRSARMVGRLVHKLGQKPGAPPGQLVHSGPRKVEKVRLRLFEYDAERLSEKTLEGISEAFPTRDNPPVGWLNVDGLHDMEILGELRDHFGIHPVAMEDVVTLGHRAKMEEYEGYILMVLPMLSFDEGTLTVQTEQLSLILGPNWVLTFQERFGDVFEPVRERLRTAHGRIRQRGADYLAYALMDAVVDRYFGILEKLGDAAEDLDQWVMENPAPEVLLRINHLKKELLLMRRSVWPLREAISAFARTESDLVTEHTQVFARDVYDHAIQIIDTVETLRDLTGGMTDLYLSSMGQRTNEVMKVLTIMASIFIPLTFMAGIYGMNFEFMPELHVRWAYPVLWLLMASVAAGMIWYFRRKEWF
ncbi:MAG: magnesium/cobalt transporter CorA [Longimicrobiales bacterium]